MKRLIMLVALLLSIITLIACAGVTPRPVIIQNGKEVEEPPQGLISTIKKVLE